MTKQFVIEYIDKKIVENEYYVRYTFFELRVKNNLSKEEVNVFFQINKDYFENKGYRVYFTGEKFVYGEAQRIVQENELMIAIKDVNIQKNDKERKNIKSKHGKIKN